jgi:hypothetical protein
MALCPAGKPELRAFTFGDGHHGLNDLVLRGIQREPIEVKENEHGSKGSPLVTIDERGDP